MIGVIPLIAVLCTDRGQCDGEGEIILTFPEQVSLML